MADLKITHPKSGATVKRNFVAYGTSKRRTAVKVKGKLKKDNDLVSEGRTILQPKVEKGFWAILFENVAVGTDYTLEVTSKDDGSATVSKIKVVDGGREIIDPLDKATVCPDFVAYGTTPNLTASVSGTMMNIVNTVEKDYSGVTIQQPNSKGSWAILFTGIPVSIASDAATKYTLDVVDTMGTDFKASEIIVDSTGC